MAEPKVEQLHCEGSQRPKLPRYLLNTEHGHWLAHEVVGEPSSMNNSEWLPRRSYGEAELKGEPWMAAARPAPETHGSASLVEELPWKLVPCPMFQSRGADRVPLTDNRAVNKAQRRFHWRAVSTNRHIPTGLPLYYMEIEGSNLEQCCIGLMSQNVRFAESKPDTNAGTNGSLTGRRASRSAGRSAHLDTYQTSSRGADGGASREAVRDTGQSGQRARRGSQESSMREDIEQSRYYDDIDVFDDGESADEAEEADDEDDDEDYDADDDTDDVGNMAADDDSEEDEDEEDEYYDADDYIVDIKLSPIGVLYRRQYERNVDDTIFETKKGRFVLPFFSWNLAARRIMVGPKVHEPPTHNPHVYFRRKYRAGKFQRIGVLFDFVSQTITLTGDGKVLGSAGEITFGIPEAKDQGNKKLFPFFIFPKGTITVHFGDGRLRNDGFMYDLSDYTNKCFKPQDVWNSIRSRRNDQEGAVSENIYERVVEYFEYYGYVEALGPRATDLARRRQQIRLSVEHGDIGLTKMLVPYTKLDRRAQRALDVAEFIELARRTEAIENDAQAKEKLEQVLALGRRLLASVENDREEAQRITDAAALLVTREPRPQHLTRLYDNRAITALLNTIFSNEQEPPKLQAPAQTLRPTEKPLTVSPTSSYAAGHLRSMHGGELWPWW